MLRWTQPAYAGGRHEMLIELEAGRRALIAIRAIRQIRRQQSGARGISNVKLRKGLPSDNRQTMSTAYAIFRLIYSIVWIVQIVTGVN